MFDQLKILKYRKFSVKIDCGNTILVAAILRLRWFQLKIMLNKLQSTFKQSTFPACAHFKHFSAF